MKLFLAAFFALLLPAHALAKDKPFDPREWRGKQAGPATQVLTIGSAHLVLLAKPVTAEMLAPVLDRLAAWKPDIITHEGISGEQCETLKQYPARYRGTWDPYCWGTEEAAAATGLSVPAAMAAAEAMLKDWPAAPTSAQRRKLAVLFLAANDRFSAQVQWLNLPPAERIAGPDVDASLLHILNRTGKARNEAYDIAVALAVRLGHQRVYAVDDHTADAILGQTPPGYDAAIGRIWTGTRTGPLAEFEMRSADLDSPDKTIAFYRFLNAPKTGRAFVEADHMKAMRDDTPERFGRQYLGWWETRNLRMIANVRAAFANYPGAHVLNVVGASHKPYYDAYLGMMSDVRVVDAARVLR
jgi:Family of unknown function (DUF5694)